MTGGVNLEVIGEVLVNSFEQMLEPFAAITISSFAFAVGKVAWAAVNAHQEDVVWREKLDDQSRPIFVLDYVIDNEIVAGLGNRREATVKRLEEAGSQFWPREGAVGFAAGGQELGGDESIRRDVPEGLR